jgi:hypothetical protein
VDTCANNLYPPLYSGTADNLFAHVVARSKMHTPLQVSMEEMVRGGGASTQKHGFVAQPSPQARTDLPWSSIALRFQVSGVSGFQGFQVLR